LYCAQVCFIAEQRKKKKQQQEEENEKRVENKERERKGGETGGGGEGRVIGDSRFSIPTTWGGGEGPTRRIRSSAASLVSLPRARFAMRASCIPLTPIIPISHCKTVWCLNTLAVGNPSHLLCILRVELDVGLA
jgi:hypothetical protein